MTSSSLELTRQWEQQGLLHFRHGLVTHLHRLRWPARLPPLQGASAQLNLRDRTVTGSGFSVTSAGEAATAALFEAIERGVAWEYPYADLRVCSAAELSSPADVERFIPYTNDSYRDPGFPLHRYAATQAYSWMPTWRPLMGNSSWLPTQIAGLGYVAPAHEARVHEQVSNGLAAHVSRAQAVEASVGELIERHAFMSAWYRQRTGPTLDAEPLWTLSPEWARLKNYLNEQGLRLVLKRLEHEFPGEVVAAFLVHEDTKCPLLSLGSAWRPTLRRAAEKAALECLQTYIYIFESRASNDGAIPLTVEEIRKPEDHIVFFQTPDRITAIRWLWEPSAGLQPLTNTDTESVDILSSFAATCRRTGRDWHLIDLTPTSLRRLGIWVVRSVVSECLPLTIDPRLKATRFLDADAVVLTPWPHPFP